MSHCLVTGAAGFIGSHLCEQLLARGHSVDGDGEQSRSNTFIAHCVQGVLLAFEKREQSIGEIFNLGGGEVVTVNQVLHVLAELTGRSPRLTFAQVRPGDQRCTAADISKAQHLLGYRPTTTVIKGLQAQLEWQLKI